MLKAKNFNLSQEDDLSLKWYRFSQFIVFVDLEAINK